MIHVLLRTEPRDRCGYDDRSGMVPFPKISLGWAHLLGTSRRIVALGLVSGPVRCSSTAPPVFVSPPPEY